MDNDANKSNIVNNNLSETEEIYKAEHSHSQRFKNALGLNVT